MCVCAILRRLVWSLYSMISIPRDCESRPRLLLHIGHFKTASSSIQRSLGLYERALADQGCLVPATGRLFAGSHHKIPWSIQRRDGRYRGPNLVPQLAEELRDASFESAVVSAEDFTLLTETEIRDLHDAISPIVDCVVVLYLRYPASMMGSFWTQLTKNGFNRLPLNDYVCKGETFMRSRIGYDAIVRRWESVWGMASMRIRTVEGLQAEGGVIRDWLTLLGLPFGDQATVDSKVHRSPPWQITDLLREVTCRLPDGTVDSVGTHLPAYEALTDAGIDLLPDARDSESVLSAESLSIIDRVFAEGNSRIARDYFGSENLFPCQTTDHRAMSQPDALPDTFFRQWIMEAGNRLGSKEWEAPRLPGKEPAIRALVEAVSGYCERRRRLQSAQ